MFPSAPKNTSHLSTSSSSDAVDEANRERKGTQEAEVESGETLTAVLQVIGAFFLDVQFLVIIALYMKLYLD